MTRRIFFPAAIICLALALPRAAAQHLLPPHSVVGGKTIGEWSADWWTWVFCQPAPFDPQTDTTGANANTCQPDGPVFFIGGPIAGHFERTFTVPAGKYLLILIRGGFD